MINGLSLPYLDTKTQNFLVALDQKNALYSIGYTYHLSLMTLTLSYRLWIIEFNCFKIVKSLSTLCFCYPSFGPDFGFHSWIWINLVNILLGLDLVFDMSSLYTEKSKEWLSVL